LSDNFVVRPARLDDAKAVAALLLEGFGNEYGGTLLTPAGRHMMERIHALPGRLTGIFVLSPPEGDPIAVAGLRTREVRAQAGWAEEQITIDELGLGRAIWLELRASLSEPSTYQPRGDEAYIYNVVVTRSWRGKGAGDRILEFLHGQAERRGKRRVLLEVVATNYHARRLYERHGYRILRSRRGLLSVFRLGVPPRLLMAKDLPG
jgi:ribosomal protein S18 acetylase RimI-like enzyme